MYRLLSLFFTMVFATGCVPAGTAGAGDKIVRVKGSDTMVILMSALAERYTELCPSARVSVTGGGTRSGISAMINRTCDVIAASRDITEMELELAREKGVEPAIRVIGRDAIAVIVNPSNALDSISTDQLKRVLSGACRNWQELGGADEPIIVYSRESSSGTFRYVQENVLENRDFASRARFLPSNTSIVDSISQESAAIGYVSYGHARFSRKVKLLRVSPDAGGKGVAPTLDNMKNGKYPLSRDLNLYLSNDRNPVLNFTDFCLSPEGQRIVEEFGLVPLQRSTAAGAEVVDL